LSPQLKYDLAHRAKFAFHPRQTLQAKCQSREMKEERAKKNETASGCAIFLIAQLRAEELLAAAGSNPPKR
jgi:hypothetical protein